MLDYFNYKYKTRYFVIFHTVKKMIAHLPCEEDRKQFTEALEYLITEGDKRFNKWWIPKFYLNKRKSEAVYTLMNSLHTKIEKEKNHIFN